MLIVQSDKTINLPRHVDRADQCPYVKIAIDRDFCKSYEPRCEKPVFGVSDQIRHKPGCTTTEDG